MQIEETPRRGRPKKQISDWILRAALKSSRNISITKLASVLGVHRNTLSKKVKELGLERKFTTKSDEELRDIIKEYRLQHPDTGISYIVSHLRSQKIYIQRWRIRELVHSVDAVGARLRTRNPIIRRSYTNPRPMAVWHMDGHLKAILWGISIHGFIDGYSRKVSLLQLSVADFHFT